MDGIGVDEEKQGETRKGKGGGHNKVSQSFSSDFVEADERPLNATKYAPART